MNRQITLTLASLILLAGGTLAQAQTVVVPPAPVVPFAPAPVVTAPPARVVVTPRVAAPVVVNRAPVVVRRGYVGGWGYRGWGYRGRTWRRW